MLADNDDIKQKNKELEHILHDLADKVQSSEKDYKYEIGLTIGENTRPRHKIFTIPRKLSLLKKAYEHHLFPFSYLSVKSDAELDPLSYHKALQENIRRLTFYNEVSHYNIIYAIGDEVYNARHSLLRFFTLPYRLWRIRKGHHKLLSMKSSTLPSIEGIDKCILFIATNGAGLGHLTRCLAIARKIKVKRPELEIIFLTTSLALTAVNREGFTAYCIPSSMLIKNISAAQWNVLLKNMLTSLLQLYPFSAVIFDGAMPYASVTAAIASEKQIPKIWIKRGSVKSDDIAEKRNLAESNFDYIIIPKEAGSAPLPNDDKHFYVDPIVYLDKNELWSKEEVRRYLKISPDKKVCYIQLGAGNINNIDSDIYKIVNELRKRGNIMMVLGESIIGNELKIIEDDIIILKDYPNAKYFNGFDFAVSACGYNSFHELLYFEVPTLFLPNMNTQTDDQYARAVIAQKNKVGFVLTQLNNDKISDAISHLCSVRENTAMRENAHNIIWKNGASEAADHILHICSGSCGRSK